MPKAQPPVSISMDFSAYKAHLFKVTMMITGAKDRLRLSLPVWTPGSYMIREFAQHLLSLEAYEGEKKLAVKKVDKNSFVIDNIASSVTIVYQVYGFDSSIRAAFIDDNQAFFNGCALCLRPHGCLDSPFLVRLLGATVPKGARWQVATSMPSVDVDDFGFGSYQAGNYDELVDYPFQISDMLRLNFNAGGVPHEMVLVGDVRNFQQDRFAHDLTKLCEHHIKFFGGIAPFSSYSFLARMEEGGYGGLEHRNSSMLLSSPYGLPKIDGEPDHHYRSFLGLCSHEYFHAWNIKRLKPKNFIPFDYDRECYTTMLWIFEGITSYYDDLALRRAGLISRESYLDMMAKNYSKLLRNRGRLRQSLAEASFDAWIKFYRPNENSNNVTTSYYLKGSFIALYLDLLMRYQSDGKKSLDDVVRAAYQHYGEEGMGEDDFFLLLEKVGGLDADEVKQRFIYGTEDVDLLSMLARFGVHLNIQGDEHTADDKTKMQAYLGFKYRVDDNGRAVITQIDYDSPALDGGLSPLDEIIAINNIRFDHSNAAEVLANIREKEEIDLLYTRKKLVKSCRVSAAALPKTRSSMTVSANLDEEEKRRLAYWLGV